MKVRFTSKKERDPTQDGGLKVMYAPSKRIAFRLRWYLILLLVASPVLWFSGKMVGSILLLDAPARTVKPMTDIRALESGVVQNLIVKAGDQISAGALLIVLENTALLAQHQAISDTLQLTPLTGTLLQRQQQVLLQQLDRARVRSLDMQGLVDMGAATRGELDQARDQLNDRQAALLEFERRLEPSLDQQAYTQRNQNDLIAIDKRLERLQIRATSDAIIRNIDVNEGESVGPGTLLMQLQRDGRVEIQVFLDARQRELGHPGQPLKLRLPDGQWLDAKVSAEPQQVSRLAPEMRSPFGADSPKLLIKVEPIEPLAEKWQLDNLPITARFPNIVQRLLH